MDSKPPSKPPPSAVAPTTKLKPKRKRKSPAVPWKKPKDMPRRPLSAYNLFFRRERETMLNEGWSSTAPGSSTCKDQSTGAHADADGEEKAKTGIGFANLARTVAAKWKSLPAEEKAPFEQEAAREKARYDSQMLGWRAEQEQKKARKAGSTQQMMNSLISGPALQAYATHLAATQHHHRQQQGYPEDWFQTTDHPTPENTVNDAQHIFGMKEHQQLMGLGGHQRMMGIGGHQQLMGLGGHQQLIGLKDQQQQLMGMKDEQHRSLLAQQEQLYLQTHRSATDGVYAAASLPQGRDSSGGASSLRQEFVEQQGGPAALGTGLARAKDSNLQSQKMSSLFTSTDPTLQGSYIPRNPGSLLELRSEDFGPARRPTLFEQRATTEGLSGTYEPSPREFGDESSFTAGLIQQSFWGAPASRQPAYRPFPEEPPRMPRVEHRSSIGTPYQIPHRASLEQPHRMARSQSFPSASSMYTSPKPSPEQTVGRASLDSRGATGLETPLTPLLKPSLPHQSPYSNAQNMLNSPNLVPTPPHHGDALSNSPRDGIGIARPLSEPPPSFPGDEEFQSIDVRYQNRQRYTQPSTSDQPIVPIVPIVPRPQREGGNGMSDIRLCEEMAADFSALRNQPTNQTNPSSLFQATFEALGSTFDNEGVDFLSNLEFEE
ncbi:expressed unknown protein [Seminavis robusta]|uniref:HMG box domain-containing protein n=1 Tax=Seminavis robusta TaxID=568900 RepID=A0A9N8D5U8_9STRA|nr:expressed unknown protein [Seminavis robusta]|eukprot:Sro12_g009270.1 n/a (659) ;mRNA; f:77447-79494